MIVAPIQTRVSFVQRVPYGEPTLPVHAKRDERAALVIRGQIVPGVFVSPLRDTTPVLTPTYTYIRFLYTPVRVKVRRAEVRIKVEEEFGFIRYLLTSCASFGARDTLMLAGLDGEGVPFIP